MFLDKESDYTLRDIAGMVKGTLQGNDKQINTVFIDSRNSVSPEGALFFALKGQRHNGHLYIADLYAKNIRCFVVDVLPDATKFPEASFIKVDNTLTALQRFATEHRKRFTYPVVGITGSNGKTIVKEWAAQLLHNDKRIVRSPKSYNSQVGVPMSVLMMNSDADIAIFEAGISEKGEMDKLEPIIRPQIGIFTTIGEAHQENFSSLEEKAREKMKLFTHIQTLIYNNNSPIIASLAEENKNKYTLFSWGSKNDSTLLVKKVEKKNGETFVEVEYKGSVFSLTIPFTDEASIEDAMHCVSLLLVLGYELNVIKERLTRLIPVAMRLELKEGVNNCQLINDSYNSDINSLTIALNYLNSFAQYNRKTLILSDILQSGRSNNDLYREVADLVNEKKITRFIGIGEAVSQYASLFECEKHFFTSTSDFLRAFRRDDFSHEIILLKGSREFRFERISLLLEKKNHQTVLEVNLDAMVHNLNYVRSLLKPTTKVMAMVKAFSYGTGSFEIANLLQYQRVDYLAVAFADEGVALREAGITMPIVVLNPEPNSFDSMISYDLEPEIYNFSSLNRFCKLAQRLGVIRYPVHIKLDTGMHRLGFMEHEINDLILALKDIEYVKVASVFSHLAASDEAKHEEFTRSQIVLFKSLTEQIGEALEYPFIKHILNSSGIERFSDAQFDMVRLGIGLYGISPVHADKYRLVSNLYTTVVQLKTISAGETVGYGRMGKITEETRIAILPIGYADGLNRKFSNGGIAFIVNGKPAPVIGNICMDTCMVDVTGIDVEEGDKVTVFSEKTGIGHLADSIGTIPYEILTSISQRVKRVYYQD